MCGEALGEWQHGFSLFRPGRGSTYLIFTMKMIWKRGGSGELINLSSSLTWRRLLTGFLDKRRGTFCERTDRKYLQS